MKNHWLKNNLLEKYFSDLTDEQKTKVMADLVISALDQTGDWNPSSIVQDALRHTIEHLYKNDKTQLDSLCNSIANDDEYWNPKFWSK